MIELGKVPDFNSQNTVTGEKRISMKGHTRGPDDLSVLSKFGSFSKKKNRINTTDFYIIHVLT